MQKIDDMEKSKILDFISELIEKEKSYRKNEQTFEISQEAETYRSSRSTKKLFSFFEGKGYHIISLTEKQQIPRDRLQLALLLTKKRKVLSPFIDFVV